MSAAFGDDDFYQNLLQYMNQNTITAQSSSMNTIPLSFSPHEAEKRGLEDEPMSDEIDTKRRGALSPNFRIKYI